MNNKSADNSTSSIDISCDSKRVPKRVFDLYENGVKLYKQKEEKYKEKQIKRIQRQICFLICHHIEAHLTFTQRIPNMFQLVFIQ